MIFLLKKKHLVSEERKKTKSLESSDRFPFLYNNNQETDQKEDEDDDEVGKKKKL